MKKPLITTNVASIPEVVSGEVIFVEPGRPKQIAHAVTHYFAGTASIKTIPAKTFLRQDCIDAVLSVYHDLLHHR